MKHSCEKISHLASEQLERRLSVLEKLSMKFHFLMCDACRNFNKNMLKLHQTLQMKRTKDLDLVFLPKQARNEIQQSIEDAFRNKH